MFCWYLDHDDGNFTIQSATLQQYTREYEKSLAGNWNSFVFAASKISTKWRYDNGFAFEWVIVNSWR